MGCFGRRLVLLLGLASLLCGSLAPFVPANAGAQTRRDEREASEQAIYISELESQGRFSRIYNLMHSDSKAVAPRDAVVGLYENDVAPLEPQPITEILDVRFIRWTWDVTGERYRNTAEIDFVQPFGSGNDVTYVEETIRLVEEDGEWRWFFGRSQNFVDEQIALYVDDDESSAQRSNRDGDGTNRDSDEDLAGSNRDCTLVELYPGYPGYRGNITGVMPHWGGTGDYACLELLEDLYPQFDKEDEDRANRRAARELGINGTFEDWTWENWMMIEALRELPMSCYSCLMYDTSTAPLNPDVRPEADDPRILIGYPGESVAIETISEEVVGSTALTISYFGDDYVVRAEAYIRLGSSANAPDILDEMTGIIHEASQAGGTWFTIEQVIDIISTYGGYVPTTTSMFPTDQLLLAQYAFSVGMLQVMPQIGEVYWDQFYAVVDDWRLSGYRGSLRDYLRENWQP